MFKRKVSGMIIALLLMNLVALALYIRSVKAMDYIYIHSDGTIEPLGAPISIIGGAYTLTENLYDCGIIIEMDGITFDGGGCTIEGIGSECAIFLYAGDIIIRNTNIKNFHYGISFQSAGNTIFGNTITSCFIGINPDYTSTCTVSANKIIDCSFGVYLRLAGDITVFGNTITNSNATAIMVTDESNLNKVSGNTITNSTRGIDVVWSSVFNTVSGNTIRMNSSIFNGISLFESSNNNFVSGNIVTKSMGAGIALSINCNDNTISGNTLTDNSVGISLDRSSNNKIYRNTIANNLAGISLSSSPNNKIYHNNFLNNALQVFFPPPVPAAETTKTLVNGSQNTWDDGYPSGGNCWSDYGGVDADGDGIGDTPYTIDADNQDRYPLIVPLVWNYSAPIPIVWAGATYLVLLSSNSTLSSFKFNQPQKEISFYVEGSLGTAGYCNVTIPKTLLSDNPWTITINDVPITDYTKTENNTHTSIFFTYAHSTKTVKIKGTNVIPEFPTATISPLLMVLSILAVLFSNKRLRRRLKI